MHSVAGSDVGGKHEQNPTRIGDGAKVGNPAGFDSVSGEDYKENCFILNI